MAGKTYNHRYRGLWNAPPRCRCNGYCPLFTFAGGVAFITVGSVLLCVITRNPVNGRHKLHTPPLAVAFTFVVLGTVLVLTSVIYCLRIGWEEYMRNEDELEKLCPDPACEESFDEERHRSSLPRMMSHSSWVEKTYYDAEPPNYTECNSDQYSGRQISLCRSSDCRNRPYFPREDIVNNCYAEVGQNNRPEGNNFTSYEMKEHLQNNVINSEVIKASNQVDQNSGKSVHIDSLNGDLTNEHQTGKKERSFHIAKNINLNNLGNRSSNFQSFKILYKMPIASELSIKSTTQKSPVHNSEKSIGEFITFSEEEELKFYPNTCPPKDVNGTCHAGNGCSRVYSEKYCQRPAGETSHLRPYTELTHPLTLVSSNRCTCSTFVGTNLAKGLSSATAVQLNKPGYKSIARNCSGPSTPKMPRICTRSSFEPLKTLNSFVISSDNECSVILTSNARDNQI
ncbi:uncharacterized protein LOC108666424 [Hyalella azteca]|uniref:Uncharacterized protein LOC108666424 n=1 Tax=Hyalella azteca TaxID=294128 RepID=A0A8B7N670_HYAAZ|nr:uncharacterized protein LOC108666424 [Hyalella azteca]